MRSVLFACIAACLFGCNSSSSKKDPNKAMDDTARMDNPPPAQVTFTQIGTNELPADLKIKGKFVKGYKWNDNAGDNLFILSRLAPYDHKDQYGDEVQSAELYAYLFQSNVAGGDVVKWEMKDGEKDCGNDITCDFTGPVSINDIDHNGINEVTFRYSLACRSDVSPAYMKQITMQNGTAYSLQGLMWLADSPEMKYDVTAENVNLEKLPKSADEMAQYYKRFGRYENEKSFANAPPSFINFAREEWLKYSKEKIGD